MAKQSRGRPKRIQDRKLIIVKLSLYPGKDDDLIEFFEGIPPGHRARVVTIALRSGKKISLEQIQDLPDDQDMEDAFNEFVF